MSDERATKAVRVGDEVHAFVGNKDGWGTVEGVDPRGNVMVAFPELPYPLTMAQPTGTYFVARSAIIEIRHVSLKVAQATDPEEGQAHD